MSSKRRLRRRSCDRKVRYSSQGAAQQAKVGIRMRTGRAHLNAYKCKFCGGWHIGHMPKQLVKKYGGLG